MCWMTVFLSKIQKQHTFSAIIFTVLVNTISFVEAQNAANESTENCPSYQSEQTSQSTAAKWEHLHFLSSKQFWVFIIRSKDSNFPCLHLQWSWMPTVELWYQANVLVFLRLIIFIMFRRCMPIIAKKKEVLGSQVWRQEEQYTNNTTSWQPSLSTTYDKWFPRAYNKLHIKQWKMRALLETLHWSIEKIFPRAVLTLRTLFQTWRYLWRKLTWKNVISCFLAT